MSFLGRIILDRIHANELNLSKILESDNLYSYRTRREFANASVENENVRNCIIKLISHDFSLKKSAPRKLLQILGLSEDAFIETFTPTVFNVFGCPLSTDIDVMCLASRDVIEAFQQHSLKMNNSIVENELSALGYDTKNREIDFNYAYIENGLLQVCSKGSKETQNIVYYTYNHHKQAHPCFFWSTVELDIMDRVRAISKFILDYLIDLVGNDEYLIERQNKINFYKSGNERIIYTMNLCEKISVTADKSAIKSLTMKIVQLILQDHDEYAYTKQDMANKIELIIPNSLDSILFLLTRGEKGSNSNINQVFKQLVSEYKRIAIENMVDINWEIFDLDVSTNPTELSNELYNEFVKFPLEPTPLFVNLFTETYGESPNLNSLFKLKCFGSEHLPESALKHSILVDQRSEEWVNLLKFHHCGRNTGVHDRGQVSVAEFYYNLIRGSIIEMIVVNNVDFKMKKCMVGLLVESFEENSLGIAPDLLLIDSDKVVPVEIKCLVGDFADNGDYRRAVKLATLQLKSSLKILNERTGIIILVYVNGKDFKCMMTRISV